MERALKEANTWDRVLGTISTKVSSHSFDTWFKPTRFVHQDEGSVRVCVPNTWFAEWLKTNYLPLIHDALRENNCQGLDVEFRPETVESSQPEPKKTAPARTTAAAPAVVTPPESGGRTLNPRYTFDSFVVSNCNQFAHAAAMAVAEQPSRAYNPLYVYGGVGLGKTHLMQAIGNRVGSGLRMHYISSETFMNELINSIRFENTQEFKQRYRNVDLLLIDDIQFLAGKERTQEEFFHTFNTLYDAQKQIVITSDVPPRDIPTLEDRLRSRFEWGLIADIQPPDLETKIAILRKKAEIEQIALPDDVALFVASACGSNVRELEGALIRVVAYASIAGRDISLDLCRETLRNFLPAESPAATVESIQKLIANYYNLRVTQLKSKTNSHQISFPRQIAMYLCKQMTACSLQEIGRRFGGKHHSTVIHGIQKIEKMREQDKKFDRLVDSFISSLK
ncbi:MAG: chromosomal replication initiator protein DnaA [bacterium]|nr:chromosomal replication initiator protein DnaA [bacterium]